MNTVGIPYNGRKARPNDESFCETLVCWHRLQWKTQPHRRATCTAILECVMALGYVELGF